MGQGVVLLLSGGKDSAWVAQHLVRRGYRVTALTVDTGFMAPVALANARRVAMELELEHVILAPDLKPLLRAAFLKRGPAISTVDLAEADEVFRLGHEFAAARGLPLADGLTAAQWRVIEGDPTTWSPLADAGLTESEVAREVAPLRLVTDPKRTNSRLIPALLILDVLRYGRSSFRPYLPGWRWALLMPVLELAARLGVFDREADRVLAELDLSLCSLS